MNEPSLNELLLIQQMENFLFRLIDSLDPKKDTFQIELEEINRRNGLTWFTGNP